jgi:hypothetical protein
MRDCAPVVLAGKEAGPQDYEWQTQQRKFLRWSIFGIDGDVKIMNLIGSNKISLR